MENVQRVAAGGPPGSLRYRAFHVIFGHQTAAGRRFDVLLIGAILISVAIVMAESVQSVRDAYGPYLRTMEWGFTLLFTAEYLVRLWCVDSPRRYAGSFFGIVDLLAVLPTWMTLALPGGQVLAVVRILRVLRVFRVLKLIQYLGEARVLTAALRASRYKITVFLFTVLGIVVVVGSLMYLIEGPNAGFTSIPKGIYWSIVTLTTVGYGDVTPVTAIGQTLAAILMILGYGIIAVPTGIVTSELTLQGRGLGRPVEVGGALCTCGHREEDARARYCRYCGGRLERSGASAPD